MSVQALNLEGPGATTVFELQCSIIWQHGTVGLKI